MHSPKHVKELSAFEKDLIAVVKNIKFRNARGYFQTALQEDTRLIYFFFTLKDHKENFQNNSTIRLINPAKNEIGRFSKVILDKINSSLIKQLKVNQWKNTQNVIEWFMKIEEKSNLKFIVFDIKDFYPSVKETLLIKTINFAKKNVKHNKRRQIKYARKSLLDDNSEPWMKEDGLFDVTMGAYERVEVCELVGTFLLYKFSLKYNKKNHWSLSR